MCSYSSSYFRWERKTQGKTLIDISKAKWKSFTQIDLNCTLYKKYRFIFVNHSYELSISYNKMIWTLCVWTLCVNSISQSMLTGLMYHRPEDPLAFLESCLQKTRDLGGPECVVWDTFITPDRKPLPPITPAQGKKAPCKLGISARKSNLSLK